MVPIVTPPVSISPETSTSSSSNEDESASSDDEHLQHVILIDSSATVAQPNAADRDAAAAALVAAADAHAATRAAAATALEAATAARAASRAAVAASNKRTRHEHSGGDGGGVGHDSSSRRAGLNRSDSDLDDDSDSVDDSAVAAAAAAAPRVNAGTIDDPIDLFASMPDGDDSRRRSSTRFSLQQFMYMWNTVNDDIGMDTEVLEEMNIIRGANSALSQQVSAEQANAQYGRVLFPATQRIFTEVLQIRKKTDVFVDFGSGIANNVIQAAFTMGCESKGIELVDPRHAVSCVYKIRMLELAESLAQEFEEYEGKKPGKITLEKGRLESSASLRFLTNPGKITKALCNNYGGVFGYRSARPGVEDSYNIDDYVAGRFCLMEEGSVLVTFHKIQLGPTRTEVNAKRAKAGLAESPNAACYEMEDIILGQARHVVSWSEGGGNCNVIHLYKYTRVVQKDKAKCDDDDPDAANDDEENKIHNNAVFLCSNVECKNAKNATPLPATKFHEFTPPGRTKPIKRVVINTCECGYTAKMARTRAKINYAAPNFGKDTRSSAAGVVTGCGFTSG